MSASYGWIRFWERWIYAKVGRIGITEYNGPLLLIKKNIEPVMDLKVSRQVVSVLAIIEADAPKAAPFLEREGKVLLCQLPFGW